MPRGAHLTNIASGLCGSFASRNNELDGYWSIGKRRSLAERHGRTTVLLDVLTSSIHPSSFEFAPVLARYHLHLAKLADLSRIRLEEITAAHIALEFAPAPSPSIRYYKPQWGDQFTLTVTITRTVGPLVSCITPAIAGRMIPRGRADQLAQHVANAKTALGRTQPSTNHV